MSPADHSPHPPLRRLAGHGALVVAPLPCTRHAHGVRALQQQAAQVPHDIYQALHMAPHRPDAPPLPARLAPRARLSPGSLLGGLDGDLGLLALLQGGGGGEQGPGPGCGVSMGPSIEMGGWSRSRAWRGSGSRLRVCGSVCVTEGM